MPSYSKIFSKPYPDGYKNKPDKSTPITAKTLNDKDDALTHIEDYLSDNSIPDSVEVTPITTSGKKIAIIKIGEDEHNIYAPSGGGEGGSTVEVTPILTEGTKIATITVDGEDTEIYSPNGVGEFYKDATGDIKGEIFNTYEGILANVATGVSSHAEGSETKATGMYSHTEGASTTASATGAHAEGLSTEAKGMASHSEGVTTKAYGTQSHAEGYYTEARGENSHSEGKENVIFEEASNSHVEGSNNKIKGMDSHVEGVSNENYGQISHVEGTFNKNYGQISHIEGQKNEVDYNKAYTHVEGYNNNVKSSFSHVGGDSCESRSDKSFLHGTGLKDFSGSKVVFGSYNSDNANTIFEIGNGSDDENRSDLFRIDKAKGVYYNDTKILDSNDISITPTLTSGKKIATITIGEVDNNIFAPNSEGGSTVEVTPILTTGTKIATIDVDGKESSLYAPSGEGSSTVEVTPILTEGTKIATITVDGEDTEIYAPNGGEGGSDVDYTSEFERGTKIGTLSIDDANKDILIPTIELTKAEYDALPATKLTDNINYMIKDWSESTKVDAVNVDFIQDTFDFQIPSNESWIDTGITINDDCISNIEIQWTLPTGLLSGWRGISEGVIPNGGIRLFYSVTNTLSIYVNNMAIDSLNNSTGTDKTISIRVKSLKKKEEPSVVVTPKLTEGTKIATITVDGKDTDIFTPNGGSGGNFEYITAQVTLSDYLKNPDTFSVAKKGNMVQLWYGVWSRQISLPSTTPTILMSGLPKPVTHVESTQHVPPPLANRRIYLDTSGNVNKVDTGTYTGALIFSMVYFTNE